jgi:hypothetical protein
MRDELPILEAAFSAWARLERTLGVKILNRFEIGPEIL